MIHDEFFILLLFVLQKKNISHTQTCHVLGECPPFSDDKECPPPLEVLHQCLIDGDCEEGFRCCSDGCQLGCVEVKAVETDEDTSGKLNFQSR